MGGCLRTCLLRLGHVRWSSCSKWTLTALMVQFSQFECEDGKPTQCRWETTGLRIREAYLCYLALKISQWGLLFSPAALYSSGRDCPHRVLTKLGREFFQQNYRFGLILSGVPLWNSAVHSLNSCPGLFWSNLEFGALLSYDKFWVR